MRSELYFAYGSNMHRDMMMTRCRGEAIPLGASVLKGWKLESQYYANIVRSKDDHVDGVLWRVTDNAIRSLDVCEGVRSGLYYRCLVKVSLKNDIIVDAWTYSMPKRTRSDKHFPMSPAYAYTCLTGAQAFKVPVHPLFKQSAQHVTSG